MATHHKYAILITLLALFFLAEISVSIYANSLSLQTDALHMLSDLLALIIGLVALRLSNRSQNMRFTYGWIRAEILGGLINSVFLLSVAFNILLEVIHRITELANEGGKNPSLERNIDLVLIIAGVGLIVNICGILLFYKEHQEHHHHHHQSKTTESDLESEIEQEVTTNYNNYAVLLHIIGDTLASVIVIITSLIIKYTEWEYKFYIDPIASFSIIIFIVISSSNLLKKTASILLHQSHDTDYQALLEKIKAIPEIESIHEFHVWSLNNKINIASLHIKILNTHRHRSTNRIITQVKNLLHRHGIHSSTVQPEWEQSRSNAITQNTNQWESESNNSQTTSRANSPFLCIEPQCHQNCQTRQCCQD